MPFGDQGIFVRRSVFEGQGGFPEIPLMEDVAIAKALRGRIAIMDASVVTSADKYQRDGWLRRGSRNLLTLLQSHFS